MTAKEFSNNFDILFNNIMSNSAPGLNEYEKSIFLTLAQESIVIDLYNGRTVNGISFDGSEELKRYLSNLIVTTVVSKLPTSTLRVGLSPISVFYQLPDDLLFITNESVLVTDVTSGHIKDTYIKVVPITQDDYFSIIKNPFKKPSKSQVLRLDNKTLVGLNTKSIVEIISKYTISTYKVRYIAYPYPIILDDLVNYNTSINSQTKPLSVNGGSNCVLSPSIHNEILNRAVLLAEEKYKGLQQKTQQ